MKDTQLVKLKGRSWDKPYNPPGNQLLIRKNYAT